MAKKGKVEEVVVEAPKIIEEKTGKSQFIFPDGSKYDGEWLSKDRVKLRHGFGAYENGPEKYEGYWNDDNMEGEGMYIFSSGSIYKGAFKNNLFNGEGTYTFSDGAEYIGSWLDNKMHGKGKYTDKDKVVFEGQFFNGYYDSGRSYVTLRPSMMI